MLLLDQLIKTLSPRNWQGIAGVARTTRAAGSVQAVTPSDSAVLSNVLFLYVTGAGNLALEFSDGTSATFAVGAGSTWDVSATKVKATGTTATGILAFVA